VVNAGAFDTHPVHEHQVVKSHVGSVSNVEYAGGVIGTDRFGSSWGPLDGQALVDRQFAARQGDGLAGEAGVEGNRVAALGGGDLAPEVTGPAVVDVGNDQRAAHPAIVERFQLWAEASWLVAACRGRGALPRSQPGGNRHELSPFVSRSAVQRKSHRC